MGQKDLQLSFIRVLLSAAKQIEGCCTYSATPRKSSISCDPKSQFGRFKLSVFY